jgi:hypothetical protein
MAPALQGFRGKRRPSLWEVMSRGGRPTAGTTAPQEVDRVVGSSADRRSATGFLPENCHCGSGSWGASVWHITSRRWGPWTERPLPEVVRVAYPLNAPATTRTPCTRRFLISANTGSRSLTARVLTSTTLIPSDGAIRCAVSRAGTMLGSSAWPRAQRGWHQGRSPSASVAVCRTCRPPLRS